MKDQRKKKVIYIIAIALAIAILASVTASISSGGSGFANMISEPIFKPVKSLMTAIVDSLEEVYGYMYMYDEILAENKQLKARVQELEEEYREYTEISEENRSLRALLDFDQRHSDANYEYEMATIISWTASNFSSSFTINKGSSSGIALHDSVISADGNLVGLVTSVTTSSSTVTTILDTTLDLGAMFYGTGETGVIGGDFKLFKDGLFKMSYIDSTAVISVGDTVITSGSGGTCPGGLVVGYVKSLGENQSGLDFHAVLTPAADLDDLSHVFVITDFTAAD